MPLSNDAFFAMHDISLFATQDAGALNAVCAFINNPTANHAPCFNNISAEQAAARYAALHCNIDAYTQYRDAAPDHPLNTLMAYLEEVEECAPDFDLLKAYGFARRILDRVLYKGEQRTHTLMKKAVL